jgi:hypothetical protein
MISIAGILSFVRLCIGLKEIGLGAADFRRIKQSDDVR